MAFSMRLFRSMYGRPLSAPRKNIRLLRRIGFIVPVLPAPSSWGPSKPFPVLRHVLHAVPVSVHTVGNVHIPFGSFVNKRTSQEPSKDYLNRTNGKGAQIVVRSSSSTKVVTILLAAAVRNSVISVRHLGRRAVAYNGMNACYWQRQRGE
jgi:hypothetical protein